MRKLLFAALLMASAGFAQTTTTVTGTIKDLTGTTVTSGQVTFNLKPSSDTTISGTARFVPSTATCLITASGVKALDGSSACTVTNNTSLTPSGTYYLVCIQPQYSSPGSCLNWYALGGTTDITTVVPTPSTLPAYTFLDLSSTQTVTGAKSFTGTTSFSGTASFTGPFSAKFTGPSPWIDVTSSTYGATGNGVTDDKAAIQAAINALPAGGGKIFFPCGNYLVKSTLTVALNVDADIFGESQGCAKIIKDFDSTPLFRSANSTYGQQTTLSANANLGDQRLTVTSSTGFSTGQWIQLDDNTGVTASVNCLSYTSYEPAALSCNLGIYQIRSIPDATHIDIRTSLDEAYTTAGLARVSVITPFLANFHDMWFAHGPDCATANACTGRFIDLIFPIEVEIHALTMDIAKLISVVQFHRGKHLKYYSSVIRNGDDSITKNGLGANTVIFDEGSSYWEYGPDNSAYKVGETVAQGSSHHGEFHHNTFNGCSDSCINVHGNKDHDISMSYNVMGGGASSDTQNTVSARCVIISDTDFNINVDNNICRNWSQAGIQAVATTQFSIANISIRNNQIFTPMTSTGVFPPNYLLSTVTNPPIAINIGGADNPQIIGNHISGAFPANSLGIQVASSRRAQLIGNHIAQTQVVAGDIGIYHITNAAQPSTQMMVEGNIVTGFNSSNCRFDLGASTFAGLQVVGNDCATGPGGSYVYGAGITSIIRSGNVGEGTALPEIAAPTGVAGADLLYPDSTAHRWKMINNNGAAKTVAELESPAFTTPDIGAATGTSLAATGAISAGTNKFNVDTNGKVTIYNNVATAGLGIAPIQNVTTLTAQTASIAFNNPFTATTAGQLYRITATVAVTTVGTAGTVASSVFCAGLAAVASPNASLVTLKQGASASTLCYVVANSDGLGYSTTVAGVTGSPQYAVTFTVERLN